jgi:quercetin dioxygenase-like cupin family protein
MWNRPYIPQLKQASVAWESAVRVAPLLASGTEVRVLSQDAASGASTCMWRVPKGWSHEKSFALDADEQLFVLEGHLTKGKYQLGPGAYLAHASGSRHEAMSSSEGALVYAMWDGALDANAAIRTPEHDIIYIDTTTTEGAPTPIPGPVPGITAKVLRQLDSTGGMTMLINIPAGWHEPRAEHHDCCEESYKLEGDIWMVENGEEQILSAGDYFFRPPRIKHGPMKTTSGTSSLIRFTATPVNHYGPL